MRHSSRYLRAASVPPPHAEMSCDGLKLPIATGEMMSLRRAASDYLR